FVALCVRSSLALRHPPTSPLFPYTTLFRSHPAHQIHQFFKGGEIHPHIPVDRQAQEVFHGLPGQRVSPVGVSHVNTLRAKTGQRSEEHTSELQSRENLVCRLLLEKKKLRRE